jgi:molybdate transport system substrate-binding protein
MKKLGKILLAGAFVLALAGCSGNSGESNTLYVSAAASLKNAYEEELIPMFQEQNEGVTVLGDYGSSGDLQTKIEEGNDADVFMSAATKQMNALIEEGIVDESDNVELLENKIVLIVPTSSTLELSSFEDITKASSIALGDPASVPAGQYAQEALTNLNVYDKITDKVSLAKDVTEVLNQVAEGSADCGIVYATDAISMSDKVKVVAEAPEGSLEKKVIYPVAVIKESTHKEMAQKFVDFLQTDEALAVFEKYGFTVNK